MRKLSFANEEIYHVYNRGTDKRIIFKDERDFQRFLLSLQEFNTLEPIGSIREHTKLKSKEKLLPTPRRGRASENTLVEIIAYCLNENHYHLLLRQVADQGVQKFMQRLGTAYTMYFNKKYERSGVLFQGRFKAIHVNTNPYLLHLSVYVNLNNLVHTHGGRASKSSWEEYVGKIARPKELCQKTSIISQFKNNHDYQIFAKQTLKNIRERKLLADEAF